MHKKFFLSGISLCTFEGCGILWSWHPCPKKRETKYDFFVWGISLLTSSSGGKLNPLEICGIFWLCQCAIPALWVTAAPTGLRTGLLNPGELPDHCVPHLCNKSILYWNCSLTPLYFTFGGTHARHATLLTTGLPPLVTTPNLWTILLYHCQVHPQSACYPTYSSAFEVINYSFTLKR